MILTKKKPIKQLSFVRIRHGKIILQVGVGVGKELCIRRRNWRTYILCMVSQTEMQKLLAWSIRADSRIVAVRMPVSVKAELNWKEIK